MSQQMHYDEPGQERQSPPFQPYQAGYQEPFMGSTGQKLSMRDFGNHVTAGQRLALAIVSVVMLVGVVAILFSGPVSFNPMLLVVLGMVCLTIMIINIVFNNSR